MPSHLRYKLRTSSILFSSTSLGDQIEVVAKLIKTIDAGTEEEEK